MCGREVKMVARTFHQPALKQSRFVSRVVIQNKMHAKLCRHGLLDEIEKLAKLKGAVSARTLSNNVSGRYIQCSKQGGGAVSFVRMRASFRLSRAHRKKRLIFAQRLNLALFVYT